MSVEQMLKVYQDRVNNTNIKFHPTYKMTYAQLTNNNAKDKIHAI